MDELSVTLEEIAAMILVVRGQRIILDEDIARLYGVETGMLIRAVTRNIERFPADFAFRLSGAEHEAIRESRNRSQGRGGRRNLPMAFTEHGVAMLSGVLRSERAVSVNIQIVRAFVRMRQMMAAQEDLSRRIDELESRYDSQFSAVFKAIRQLMAPPETPRRPVGFRPPED